MPAANSLERWVAHRRRRAWWTNVAKNSAWIVYMVASGGIALYYLLPLHQTGEQSVQRVLRLFGAMWSPTHDPILNFIIDVAVAGIGIALVPGILTAMMLVVGLALSLLLVMGVVWLLAAVASASPTGTVVVVGGVAFALWTVARRHRDSLRAFAKTLEHTFDLVIAMAAWFARRLRVRKAPPEGTRTGEPRLTTQGAAAKTGPEEDVMAASIEVQEEALRAELAKVSELTPEVGPAPKNFFEYSGWFQEAIKRVQLRSMSRTRDVALTVLRQANAMYEEILKRKRLEGDLQSVDKENRLKGRRLDVEDRRLDAEEAELKVKIAEQEDKLRRMRGDASRDGKADRPAGFTAEMEKSIKSLAEMEAARETLKAKYPEQAEAIEKWAERIRGEIMEGRR